nr:hypothetical protein L204_05346 [Cryptococcus depauperatus CBS 7855]
MDDTYGNGHNESLQFTQGDTNAWDQTAGGEHFPSTGAGPSQNTFAGLHPPSWGGMTLQTTCNAYSGGSTVQASLPSWQVDHNEKIDLYLKDNGEDKETLKKEEGFLYTALYTLPSERNKEQRFAVGRYGGRLTDRRSKRKAKARKQELRQSGRQGEGTQVGSSTTAAVETGHASSHPYPEGGSSVAPPDEQTDVWAYAKLWECVGNDDDYNQLFGTELHENPSG